MPWQLRQVEGVTVDSLVQALGVHPVTARCMATRGVTSAGEAEEFLDPRLGRLRPPYGLPDLEVAVARMARAARAGERVGVFGDYDVDGVTTCALLTSFLRDVGVPCVSRVAQREAGYGFGKAEVAAFAEAGCSLMLVGDCGTSDVEPIAHARTLGIDTIVVDHHTVPAADAAHPAVALVNPLRADSAFPFSGMASVGLSFYVVAALRTALREAGHFSSDRREPDVRELLDLVAVGTIADLVPLVGENRILAHAGLRELARRRRHGLAALLERAEVGPDRPIDEVTVGWKISPRINAPGRLGDAGPALSLLLSRDRAEADHWASSLEQANDQRRELQAEVFAEAVEAVGDGDPGAAVVVSGEGWPSGVVGIVAAKLVERYHRPAVVIAIDAATGEGRGSARGVPGVNLYEVLHASRDRLRRYGGHAGAAGLTVDRAQVASLREELHAAVAAQRQAAPPQAGKLLADAEVRLRDVNEALVRELESLRPFGKGNDAPLLLCRGLRVRDSRCVGDGSHLKLQLVDADGEERSAIAFGLADQDPGLDASIDVAFAPEVSEWQGRSRVELRVRHIELAPGAADPS